MGVGPRAGVDGLAGSREGGMVGVARFVACLRRTYGWLVQVMNTDALYIYTYVYIYASAIYHLG
jgi:hypothetical protein